MSNSKTQLAIVAKNEEYLITVFDEDRDEVDEFSRDVADITETATDIMLAYPDAEMIEFIGTKTYNVTRSVKVVEVDND
jgi:hypothetical protein